MSSDLWPAPYRGDTPISATITIPGSKSVTNRALILASIASSPSTLIRPLRSRDTELMMKGLRSLGITIEESRNSFDDEVWIVTPQPMFGPASIDVGNAGTVMRFLPPLASLARGLVNFDGDPRSHERPLGPVISALEALGVTLNHNGRYALPMTINGAGHLNGGIVEIDASASSQFISALLLIGPATKAGITVRHTGGQVPSQPHIDMTLAMLEDFGATIERPSNFEWRVLPGKLQGRELVIEPDLSNAAPFMAAPIIAGGSLTIRDWPKSTTQPGDQLRDIFSKMGAAIEYSEVGLTITGQGKIHGIDIDLHDVGELTPSIAALATLASTPSNLRGIGHLRLHETDRLAALAREINSLGGDVMEEESALRINPASLHAGIFHTYEDHRLATAGAIIGLAIPGIEVENIATTRKTLPDFPGLWSSVLEG